MKRLTKSETVRGNLDMPRSSFERLVKLRTHGFPAPIYISRSRFFDAAEIEAWLATRTATNSNEVRGVKED